MRIFLTLTFGLVSALGLWAAADDIELILRDEFAQAPVGAGWGGLGSALSEVDIGYYVRADENHQWRARVMGDISLVNYFDQLNWHMGLSMATLADLQNDIKFRLVQVYYEALTGVKWNLGSSWLHLGYRHRCSHGTDAAEASRITIRSGLTASYAKGFQTKHVRFDIKPGMNYWVFGQNQDHKFQPKAGFFTSAQAVCPFTPHLGLVLGMGINLEIISEGKKNVYFARTAMDSWRIEPIYAARLGVRITRDRINSDVALAYKQILDSSIGPRAVKLHNLSVDMNFLW